MERLLKVAVAHAPEGDNPDPETPGKVTHLSLVAPLVEKPEELTDSQPLTPIMKLYLAAQRRRLEREKDFVTETWVEDGTTYTTYFRRR